MDKPGITISDSKASCPEHGRIVAIRLDICDHGLIPYKPDGVNISVLCGHFRMQDNAITVNDLKVFSCHQRHRRIAFKYRWFLIIGSGVGGQSCIFLLKKRPGEFGEDAHAHGFAELLRSIKSKQSLKALWSCCV